MFAVIEEALIFNKLAFPFIFFFHPLGSLFRVRWILLINTFMFTLNKRAYNEEYTHPLTENLRDGKVTRNAYSHARLHLFVHLDIILHRSSFNEIKYNKTELHT